MKYFNYNTYNLNRFLRKLNFKKYDFSKFINHIKFKQINPKKIYKISINQIKEYEKLLMKRLKNK